jgi:hypothetical protein
MDNFRALLRERGKIVPGSLREGHNVFTDAGRGWLASLTAWSTIGVIDIPYQTNLIWGVQVGSASHPEARQVSSLKAPVAIAAHGMHVAPVVNKQIVSSFPYTFGVRLTAEFVEEDLWPTPTLVKEAGLMVASATADGTSFGSIVVAYKAFAPLLKTTDFRLEVQWDLRF